LPTVSAAQALDELKIDPHQFIPTGLEALDQALADVSLEDGDESERYRGIQKGRIVEVWGPPGSGKTTFAYSSLYLHYLPCLMYSLTHSMQLAANTLRDSCRVVWVGRSSPVPLYPTDEPRMPYVCSSCCRFANRDEQTHFTSCAITDLVK
jgi:hypothetical protein